MTVRNHTIDLQKRKLELKDILQRWNEFYEEPLIELIRFALSAGSSAEDISEVLGLSLKNFYKKYSAKIQISDLNQKNKEIRTDRLVGLINYSISKKTKIGSICKAMGISRQAFYQTYKPLLINKSK